ncbi:MAG TPA: glycosyltransferase family 39 protein [Candidatus Aquilonibacter sp.]|nr:glycosyltransferase family 39 protein [Candidatus Aquilonibacter sp.]
MSVADLEREGDLDETTDEPGVAGGKRSRAWLIVLLIASAIYLGCIVSPPSLVDDVDAVQAQIARTMLVSGDWVTARIDGVAYVDKAPLIYWAIAASYRFFGVHDWAARVPVALSAIALALVGLGFGTWAFGRRAGFYTGLCLATCVGLWLFTRIQIPDVTLTCVIALSLWAFLRALDDDELHPRRWAAVFAASLGLGLLLKSLVGILFPIAAAVIYLLLTRELLLRRTWRRLHVVSGLLIAMAIAAPWHILATLRNPPYFAWVFHSGPGQYHGFLWHYVINEQVLRFLNRRYPHDYDTVPRLWFWLSHLVWLFPWSVYLPAVAKLSFKPDDRAGRARLLALCWIGFVLVFFTFSTTQEYYSMPVYPAFALLIGSAMALGGDWVRRGTRALAAICAVAALAIVAILVYVHGLPTPSDISEALVRHPKAYKLSLGHMEDLTLDSFAYLRAPLVLAGCAFLLGALGSLRAVGQRAFLAAALMMVLFFHAARTAMVVFDPYLSSHPLATALLRLPEGQLITQGHYYPFSSVFFYTNRAGLLYSDRRVNLEYGSNAPGAPHVFIDDAELKGIWSAPERAYLVTFQADLPRYGKLFGQAPLEIVTTSGGKALVTNHPLPNSGQERGSASSVSD